MAGVVKAAASSVSAKSIDSSIILEEVDGDKLLDVQAIPLHSLKTIEIVKTLPAPRFESALDTMGGNLLPDVINKKPSKSENEIQTKPPKQTNYQTFQNPDQKSVDEPIRIIIPAIGLDAPVMRAKMLKVKVSGYIFDQWSAPEQPAAGWHPTSAVLGKVGNTVLNGHHNDFGEVFKHLVDLRSADTILVFSENSVFTYIVTNKLILQEVEVPLTERMQNSRWIAPTNDERLTLVTCWPYESNTHRLVIVAARVP